MLSMINRGRLEQPVQEEFEHLIGRLRGLLSQSFDEDGNLIVAAPDFAVVPIGGLVPFTGVIEPAGFLFCDGRILSRVTYKPLFDVIGVGYGPGDGTTSFGIPDFRGRAPVGAGVGSGLSNRLLGVSFGEEAHILNTSELAQHTHDLDTTHRHRVLVGQGTGVTQVAIAVGAANGGSYEDVNDRGTPYIEAPLGGATKSNGGGIGHNNMQPSLAVQFLIYAGVLDTPTRARR